MRRNSLLIMVVAALGIAAITPETMIGAMTGSGLIAKAAAAEASATDVSQQGAPQQTEAATANVVSDKLNIGAQILASEPKLLSSVIVMHQGSLVHESYYNGAKADGLHDFRSASKSLTGLMFGVALHDGYFNSEHDRVLPLFKDYEPLLYPSAEKSAMSFFDLLSMTNPLECDDMNNFSAGNEERMYLRKDWLRFFFDLPSRANPPWEAPMDKQPFGRDFSYCTAGISITAAAIERASGKRLSDYADAALLKPIGVGETQWLYSATGITQGGGGLRIAPRDFLKIGELILNKGRWGDKQLLPAEWIAKSLTAYSESMPELNASYGLTFWQFPYEIKGKTINAFAAAGNGGNYLFIVPELQLTAVIAATAYNTPYMHKQSQSIFAAIVLPAIVD